MVGDGAVRVADHRLHKFVGNAVGVSILHSGHRNRVDRSTFAVNHGVIGGLHPVPAFVPVHGVKPSHHGGDFAHAQFPALFHCPGHKVRAGGGRHIPPIQKCVDVNLFQSPVSGHLHQGKQMLQVGVNAAVAEQAHEMQGGIVFPAGVHGADIGRIFKKAPIVNGFADAGQILKHHPACADIGMAHLAVAHLSGRQTHIQPGCGQLRVGELLKELLQTRCGGGSNSVALRLMPQAEAVHDDKRGRSFIHRNLISHNPL